TKIAANASRSKNRTAQWLRDKAAEVTAEADSLDEAEDAEDADGGGGGGLPPQLATRKARAANLKKALAELDRQDAEHDQIDQADRARAESYLAAIEAGEIRQGRVPNGVDPVLAQRARLGREQRRIGEVEGIGGAAAARTRAEARRAMKRIEKNLAAALEQVEQGPLDLRGTAERERDRREARSRSHGGTGRVVNTTDPDSRLMTEGSGGGSVQGYNAQIAVTDDHLILGIHISQDANDTNCYTPTLNAATTNAKALGKNIELVLADAGYFTDTNLDADGPDRLIAPGKHRDLAREQRDNPTTGPPPPDLDAKAAMQYRLRNPQNAAQYKRRSATVEPVIGHLKDKTKLRRFARRGIQAVTAELNLAAAVLNLTKLHQAAPMTG
uniref:transposase n=1 Tax=Nocardioides jensenii TaxID=1843 RepID=UPI00082C316C